MAELMVDFITSLDGYGAAEGWPGWWGLQGPEYDEFAEVPKVVFSSTLQAPLTWPNARLIRGDAVDAVREMKAERGRPDAHPRQRDTVPLAHGSGPRRSLPRRCVPCHHGETGRDRIYDGYPDVALEPGTYRLRVTSFEAVNTGHLVVSRK